MNSIVPRRDITTDDRRGVGVVNASVAEGSSLVKDIMATSKANIERIRRVVYPLKGCLWVGDDIPTERDGAERRDGI